LVTGFLEGLVLKLCTC